MRRWVLPLLGAIGLGAWLAMSGDDTDGAAEPMVRPIPGPIFSWFRETGRPGHQGVDIEGDQGEPVRAAWAGTVQHVQTRSQWAGRAPGPGKDAGAYIEVSHVLGELPEETSSRIGRLAPVVPGGPGPIEYVVTRYMHLATTGVEVGQTVRAGEVIGTVGRTGVQTSRTHLHFEVRVQHPPQRYGEALDPVAVGVV